LISCIAVVNVLTIRHDAPRLGTLGPAIWEGSSALVTMVIFMIPAAVAVWTTREPRRAGGGLLRSTCCGRALFGAARLGLRGPAQAGLSGLHGRPYQFGPLSTEFPYEFRKDLMAYGLASIIFYLSLRRSAREPPPRPRRLGLQPASTSATAPAGPRAGA
jgi:hypothetical protein